MFGKRATRLLATVALLIWPLALAPEAMAQRGGGHFGGGGRHYGGGYRGGHYGYGGHYGGYSGRHGYSGRGYGYYGYGYSGRGYGYYGRGYWPFYSGYGSYPYSYGLSLGPWYGYYGYGGPSYGYYGYGGSPWYGYYGYGGAYSYRPRYGVRASAYYAPDSADRITPDEATTSGSLDYRSRAEAAFRARDYDDAVRWANHATVEMPRNGKHFQFLSQALFATGDFRGAAATAQQSMALSDSKDWGDVVKNSRRYYTGGDYADQLKRLEQFVEKNPKEAYARFLLGYQYGFMGHQAEASRELAKAAELESRDESTRRLLELFGGKAPVRAPGAKQPAPAPAERVGTGPPSDI